MMHRILLELAEAARAHLQQSHFESNEDRAFVRRFVDDLAGLQAASPAQQMPRGDVVRALKFAPMVLSAQPDGDIADLYHKARLSFGAVHWTEFYKEDAWSRDFLPRFAEGTGIGPRGPLLSQKAIVGLFLFGPHMDYPAHAHPAEEFYLVLGGQPEFQVGAHSPYIRRAPGDVILHRSNESHAMRTDDRPCFGVYAWRGEIEEPSWYRTDMTDDTEPKKFPPLAK